jgi:hypothetical protein
VLAQAFGLMASKALKSAARLIHYSRCAGTAALVPFPAAGLIHARRVLKSSAEGKNTPDDNIDEDLVYVGHLRRALAASTSGSTADLNDEERVLLKEIESVDTASSK